MKKTLTSISAAALALSALTASFPVTAAENDYLLHSTFEEGKEQWNGRGSASVKTVSGKSRSGQQSLYTSGRESDWNGATVALGSDFKAGSDYSFSAHVMTEEEESVTFCLTLQYTDGTGTKNYPKIAEASAKKDEWTHLENNSFTIPDDASEIELYVETKESKCSFYLDEVVGAAVGTEIAEPKGPAPAFFCIKLLHVYAVFTALLKYLCLHIRVYTSAREFVSILFPYCVFYVFLLII